MTHAFEIHVRSRDAFRGEATPAGVPHTVPFSTPAEFGGPGGEWTPEHFFAAAIGTCIMETFFTIAQMSKLSVAAYESRVSCAMEKGEAGYRMTEVTVSPRIKVPAEKDRERAQRMIEKAEKMCPISNSVKTQVTVQASVEVA